MKKIDILKIENNIVLFREVSENENGNKTYHRGSVTPTTTDFSNFPKEVEEFCKLNFTEEVKNNYKKMLEEKLPK